MNSKKIWLFALLIAMSYSVMHDYAFNILDDDRCSVQEYVSELSVPNSNTDGDLCDVHFEYHTSFLCPIELVSLPKMEKIEDFFIHNKIFLSRNFFDFFKPPTA